MEYYQYHKLLPRSIKDYNRSLLNERQRHVDTINRLENHLSRIPRPEKRLNENGLETYYKLKYYAERLQGHLDSCMKHKLRAVHLTRGFMRGIPYKTIESQCKDPRTFEIYVASLCVTLLKVYGTYGQNEDSFVAWLEE